MHVMIDCRPLVVAPQSGIARQADALLQACRATPDTRVSGCAEAPLDSPVRTEMHCPPWASPLNGLQRPGVRWRFEARFLPRLLRQQQPDIYIATANMGLPISRKQGARWVILIHDLFQLTENNFHRSRFKALLYRMIDRVSIAWSLYRADAIWCPSTFTARQIEQHFPGVRSKVRVLPNLVTPLAPAQAQPADIPGRYWLVVGTREPRKNIPFFIRTWLDTAKQTQLPELVLVGDPLDFPQFAGQPGIHWRNGLTDEALSALYRHAECLWQPSRAEGFGLPVVEALMSGTPVAVASGSALDEVAPPDSPRFAPADREQLQTLFLQLASRPQARNQHAFAGWAKQFDSHAHRRRVGELLKELQP